MHIKKLTKKRFFASILCLFYLITMEAVFLNFSNSLNLYSDFLAC